MSGVENDGTKQASSETAQYLDEDEAKGLQSTEKGIHSFSAGSSLMLKLQEKSHRTCFSEFGRCVFLHGNDCVR